MVFKIVSRILFVVFLTVSLYLISVIGIGVATDYQPEPVSELIVSSHLPDTLPDSVFTFLSWNIGYCGLGKEMDFFYDGGEMIHPKKQQVEKYTKQVLDFLQSQTTTDFFLLQEVDKNSKRTQKQNQKKLIENRLNSNSSFGYNYKVKFVPIPLFNPLGRVEMGQINMSKVRPVSSQRHSFYAAYSWPKRLFMLDRCFVVSRFLLKNQKELVVVNTHNSAYDSAGKLREQEMPVIRDFMVEEYKKGNYVVAGGDWNQNPESYDPDSLKTHFVPMGIEKLDFSVFPPDWNLVFDKNLPTNRSLDFPLTKEKTKVTVIDFFILSPNIQAEEICVIKQNFEFSDHEPVFLKVSLK